ncbi:MAG: hypothetical protein AAF767_00140 [Pseudomonadota bacterium]
MDKVFSSGLSGSLIGLTVLGSATAEDSARYLYLENCGETALSHIWVERKTLKEGAEWKKTGRHWVHLPLQPNEAACFDTADMYGDVPEGDLARLVMREASGGSLIDPIEVATDEGDPEDTEMSCPGTRVDKANDGDLRVFRWLSYSYVDVAFFLERGCHDLTTLDWQPRNLCSGPGERTVGIQC